MASSEGWQASIEGWHLSTQRDSIQAIMRLGIWEILLILIVAMLFFGPKRLTDLGPALGKSIRGFKKGLSGDEDHSDHGHAETPPPPNGNTRP